MSWGGLFALLKAHLYQKLQSVKGMVVDCHENFIVMDGVSAETLQKAATVAATASMADNFDQLRPDSKLFAINLQAIEAAHTRIKPFIHETPVVTSQQLDAIAGLELYFKVEALQRTGSFKASFLFTHTEAARNDGLVSAGSRGNECSSFSFE